MSSEQHPGIQQRFSTVILAAGVGKRMYSDLPKILHPILGKPIVSFVVGNAQTLGTEEIIVVVGADAEPVKNELGTGVQYALQREPRGTGDAACCGLDVVKHERVLILYGDVPLLSQATLVQLMHRYAETKADLCLLTCHMDDPYGYGRILRDQQGNITGIVEQSDVTGSQAAIQEINAGVYFGTTAEIMAALRHISAENNQGELYLTDIIATMLEAGKTVTAHKIHDADEITGINTKVQLARARDIVKERWLNELMMRGVFIEDPGTTVIDLSVRIGANVRIRPCTIIEGDTTIPDNAVVGPFTWIANGKQQPLPPAGR